MMANKPTVTKTKIEQIIDLDKEFGIDFTGKRALKLALGQAIIDKIVSRTKSGRGIRFSSSGAGQEIVLKSPYSDKYADSRDFKAFGKTKNDVNLTLTGDMLAGIEIANGSNSNKLKIKMDEDETGKAYNHQVGDTVPERPFFGVSSNDLKSIKSEFSSEIREALKAKQEQGKKAFDRAVFKLIRKIENGES
jgi:hypothetical protein